MTLNLADLYEAVADSVPDRTALVCEGERRTFDGLDRNANRVAHQLIARGVEVGDHVGIHMRNSVEFVETLLGILKVRAVPIAVNFRYTGPELAYLYENAQLTYLVADAEFVPAIASALPSCRGITGMLVLGEPADRPSDGVVVSDYSEAIAAESDVRDFEPRSADDHFIVYTGGTTGRPKGVVWRHEDFYVAALGGGNYDGDPIGDPAELGRAAAANAHPLSVVLPAPLMHGAAVYSMLSGLYAGGKQVLMRSFDPVEALRLIQDEQAMCFMVVGDAIARPFTAAVAAHGHDYDLSSLALVGSGGALWSRSSKEELRHLLPNIFLRDGFGASESGVDGTLEIGADGLARVRSNPNMQVVDERLRPIPPGSKDVGYIARIGHVPIGYFNDPVKTAETFPVVDGIRMAVLGDMGRVEDDGTIVLLGRGSVCINTGGEKVFPEEVEQALKSHPAVEDAVVTGIPHDRFGEQVAAVVQLRPGVKDQEPGEITEHCRAQLAGYKIPRTVVIVPEILRSPAGKADYRWARATVGESLLSPGAVL